MTSSSPVLISSLSRAFSQLRGIWQARNQGERRLIAIASALMLLLIGVILLDWLNSEQRRLARILPRLETQIAGMEAAAKEIAVLRSQPAAKGTSPSLQVLAEAVTARVRGQGLSLAVTTSGESIGIRGSAPFDASIQLLGILHQADGLRVQKAEMQRQGDGQASMDIVLVAAAKR